MVDTTNFPDLPEQTFCVLRRDDEAWTLQFKVSRPGEQPAGQLQAAWNLARSRPGADEVVVALRDAAGEIHVWENGSVKWDELNTPAKAAVAAGQAPAAEPVPATRPETKPDPHRVEAVALSVLPSVVARMPRALAIQEAFSLAEDFLSEAARRKKT